MVISSRGRYALRMLVDLAQYQGERYIPLKEISMRQEISEKYLGVIAKTLLRGQFVVSLRGKGGGYRLSAPAEEIRVVDVLRLMDKTLEAVECLKLQGKYCPRGDYCRTTGLWKGLNGVVETYLSQFTLQDVVSGGEECFRFQIYTGEDARRSQE